MDNVNLVSYILTYENNAGDLLAKQITDNCIRNAVKTCDKNILSQYKNDNYVLIDIKIVSNNTIQTVDLEDWNGTCQCG